MLKQRTKRCKNQYFTMLFSLTNITKIVFKKNCLLKADLLNTYIDCPRDSIGFIKVLLNISANTSVNAIEYFGFKCIASLYFLHSSKEYNYT